jgi:hypothetical protein
MVFLGVQGSAFQYGELQESLLISSWIFKFGSTLGILDAITLRCGYEFAISGVGISDTLLGMSSHSRTGGKSKVTILSIEHTRNSWTFLPYKAVLPEHVVRVNWDGTLAVHKESSNSGDASVIDDSISVEHIVRMMFMENIHKECFSAGSSLECVTTESRTHRRYEVTRVCSVMGNALPAMSICTCRRSFIPMKYCGVVVTSRCFTPNFHLAVFGIVFNRNTTSGAYVFAL